MDDFPYWLALPAIFVQVQPVFAAQYLTLEQAQDVLFTEATSFIQVPLFLNDAQREQLRDISATRTPLPENRIWQAIKEDKLLGYFIVDEVYGKHEFITYALAVDAAGTVSGIEIMEYRETHGGEIREPTWRAQFLGKKHGDALKLNEDIQNISGATLSCKHIADGVKRLVALHALVLRGN